MKELADAFRKRQEMNLLLMFYKYVIKKSHILFSWGFNHFRYSPSSGHFEYCYYPATSRNKTLKIP